MGYFEAIEHSKRGAPNPAGGICLASILHWSEEGGDWRRDNI